MSTYHVHKVGHLQSSQDSRRDVLVEGSELGVQQDRRYEFTKHFILYNEQATTRQTLASYSRSSHVHLACRSIYNWDLIA